MRFTRKIKRAVPLSLLALAAVCLLSVSVCRAGTETGREDSKDKESVSPSIVQENYSGLAGLVTMVCSDGSKRFDGFFNSARVQVDPFVVLGEFKQRQVTLLGATMADQMTAMINNQAMIRDVQEADGKYVQKMFGVLQELDGFLRIHICGVNSSGERRSFVVNVEMSEPVYRALHTYVGR